MSETHGFEGVNPAILDRWRRAPNRISHPDPGPDWLSMMQLAELWGLTRAGAKNKLAVLRDRGLKVRVAQREIRDATNRVRSIPVYLIEE